MVQPPRAVIPALAVVGRVMHCHLLVSEPVDRSVSVWIRMKGWYSVQSVQLSLCSEVPVRAQGEDVSRQLVAGMRV